MKDPKFGYHWIWIIPVYYAPEAYHFIYEKIKEYTNMKVRVVVRYNQHNHWLDAHKPMYFVDTWNKLFWFFGFWKTRIKTPDYNYACTKFNEFKEFKQHKKMAIKKDKVLLIHHEST